jgi:hypothetical protein
MRFAFTLLFALILSGVVFSQTTINDTEKKPKSLVTTSSTKHKVLLIPFTNKLYLSEIDHVINAETNQTQKEIRWEFKDGLDEALYKQFKSKFDVVSLIEDTVKNKKEIALAEAGIGYKYDKVPDQKNYKAPKSDYKQDVQIKNGQIIDEVNSEARFMNARLVDNTVLEKLNKKYKTDLFVIINELDIKGAAQTNDFNADKNRTAVIHYTVFTLEGKEINSGIATVKFPKNLNQPAKISSSYFTKVAAEISERVQKALQPQSNITGNK